MEHPGRAVLVTVAPPAADISCESFFRPFLSTSPVHRGLAVVRGRCAALDAFARSSLRRGARRQAASKATWLDPDRIRLLSKRRFHRCWPRTSQDLNLRDSDVLSDKLALLWSLETAHFRRRSCSGRLAEARLIYDWRGSEEGKQSNADILKLGAKAVLTNSAWAASTGSDTGGAYFEAQRGSAELQASLCPNE